MMPRKKTDVERGLVNKGFVQSEGDHHFFVYYTIDGRKSEAHTKTSHTQKMKEIPDNLLGAMARQCCLKRSQFLDLVDCPLSREEFEVLLGLRDPA